MLDVDVPRERDTGRFVATRTDLRRVAHQIHAVDTEHVATCDRRPVEVVVVLLTTRTFRGDRHLLFRAARRFRSEGEECYRATRLECVCRLLLRGTS